MTNKIALVVMLLLYGLACALPAMPGRDWLGIACLGLPLTFPFALLMPWWWANPLFFGGCVMLAVGKVGAAGGMGLLAFLLGLVFVGFAAGRATIPIGCYLWIASLFVLMMAGFGSTTPAPGKPEKPGGMLEL